MTATFRSMTGSWPIYTVPMPPRPATPRIVYLPSFLWLPDKIDSSRSSHVVTAQNERRSGLITPQVAGTGALRNGSRPAPGHVTWFAPPLCDSRGFRTTFLWIRSEISQFPVWRGIVVTEPCHRNPSTSIRMKAPSRSPSQSPFNPPGRTAGRSGARIDVSRSIWRGG